MKLHTNSENFIKIVQGIHPWGRLYSNILVKFSVLGIPTQPLHKWGWYLAWMSW